MTTSAFLAKRLSAIIYMGNLTVHSGVGDVRAMCKALKYAFVIYQSTGITILTLWMKIGILPFGFLYYALYTL